MMKCQSRCCANTVRGFTIVELLTVVGLVAVLVGVLLPTVGSIRHSARQTQCLTQMRQLQQANWLYMTDHRGWLLDVGLAHGGSAGSLGVPWVDTLETYADEPLLVQSPLDTSPHWPHAMGGEGVPIPGTSDTFRRTSYGCNSYLSPSVSPADPPIERLSMVTNPTNTVHFLIMAYESESGFAGSDHAHAESWNDAGEAFITTLASDQVQINAVAGAEDATDARSNYGFLDGHVETLMFSQVYVSHEFNRFNPEHASAFAMQLAGATP